MDSDRELRVASVVLDGIAHVQVGYWRRKGPLLVPVGGSVIIDGRDLDTLVIELLRAQTRLAALGRRA